MPIEMALWRLDDNETVPVGSSSLATEKRLEELLEVRTRWRDTTG